VVYKDALIGKCSLIDLSICDFLIIRYQANNKRIRGIMQSFGFIELIKPDYQTYIITSYYYPPAPFHFETFYNKLSEKSRGLYTNEE
jgi:hypothetical protein